jgi:Ca2+-binding RTX toxin-like protein
VIGTFSSTDPDAGNTFTYSLVSGTGDTDNTAFSIVGNQLQINNSPDFETKNSYSIRVKTTDQGGLEFEKTFVVTVNDLNETPNPQNVVFGTPNGDQLISPRDLDGIKDIVFTGAGNDEVDIPSGGSLTGDNRIFTGSGNDTIFGSNGDRAFGGSGDDKLDATDATGYRLSGGIGNDIFYLGANGRALGGEGNDQFYVQEGGGNLIAGGAGADQFWIVNVELPTAANTILDFSMGTDVLGIAGQGANFGFNDLTLSGNSIMIGNTTIAILRGIDTTSLTTDHFTFDKKTIAVIFDF